MKMLIKPIWTIILLLAAYMPAHAGWSENMRLTYRGNEISPQVIARNDTVHVTWYEMGAGKVLYIRSTNGGESWGSIVELSQPNHYVEQANLSLDQRGLLVSWFDDDRTQGNTSIAIAKSATGATWSAPSYVYTQNTNNFGLPVSAVKGDSIFLVYFSDRDDSTGLSPFKSMHSYNYGATWSSEVTVGHPHMVEVLPTRMKYCSGALLFAYTGNPDSGAYKVHIIGYRSTDAGRTWSDTIWVSPNTPNWSLDACLSCNKRSNQIIAGYTDYRYQIYAFHGDIFATISNNEGLTWPDEYQATNNHTALVPSIDYVGDTIVTSWSDMRYYPNGYHEIVFNRSNDGGLSWLGEERITNTPDESNSPWVSLDNGKIHVVWWELVGDSDADIFYKRFTPDSIDDIEEPDILPPNDFSLSAYPNPFNSSITIIVNSNKSGVVDICDIQGRIIKQYPFEKGIQRIVWDAKTTDNQPLSSGVYFIGQKGEVTKTIKVVYMK
jgi:hypothetical protein